MTRTLFFAAVALAVAVVVGMWVRSTMETATAKLNAVVAQSVR